ncbi:MAG: sulfatase-like hydrolase/transferase [Pseudoflavonifractor sp.]|nr:sulfatase-like hydrolase/transferase [Alloprevotella sp.]MCM1117341.1 sulfatase-like hydrolase/transferase [Pseudoflavonifractor sp.]
MPWRKAGTGVLQGNEAMIIGRDQYTVADMFHDAGYATAAIGKWHLGLGSKTGQQDWNGRLDLTPSDIGFDYHYIQAATADRVPCVYIEQDTVANYDSSSPIQVSYYANFDGEPTGVSHRSTLRVDWTHGHNQSIVDSISRIGYMKGGGKALWKDANIADSIVAHSRRFIMEHKDDPFFMCLCTNDVHVPRWPHGHFRGRSSMGLRGDAISSFDWTVGEVMKALEDAGVDGNTLVIITSDNGPVMDDGYDDKAYGLLAGHQPTGGFRGDKYSNYEGGTMVPMIVRWPARVKPQAEANATLMSLIDLFGSMGSLIGVDLPAGAAPDSGDMLAQLLGESRENRPWVSELGQKTTISVRTDRWKYIPATASNGQLGWNATGHDGAVINTGDRTGVQLFDMQADPFETTNVAGQYPDTVARMEKVWRAAADRDFEEPMMSIEGDEHWYAISTPLRDNRVVCLGSDGSVTGAPQLRRSLARAQWKFTRRPDGMVNFINRATGQYLDPSSVPETSNVIDVSDTEPQVGWQFEYAVTKGHVVVYVADGSVQLNQTVASNGYRIVNWGEGDTMMRDANSSLPR